MTKISMQTINRFYIFTFTPTHATILCISNYMYCHIYQKHPYVYLPPKILEISRSESDLINSNNFKISTPQLKGVMSNVHTLGMNNSFFFLIQFNIPFKIISAHMRQANQ